jgi:hypothetical protein
MDQIMNFQGGDNDYNDDYLRGEGTNGQSPTHGFAKN